MVRAERHPHASLIAQEERSERRIQGYWMLADMYTQPLSVQNSQLAP